MKKSVVAIGLTVLLSACSSNNIKSFRVDPMVKHDLPHANMGRVFINKISMPEGDVDSIMCRAVGNIYLPEKMTYSTYISDAFRKTLLAIDKYSETPAGAHSLDVKLLKVTFSSMAGEWVIDASVSVDGGQPVAVNSVTQYGTAYIAETACRNTADAFDVAAAAFVRQVLTSPEITKTLK